MSRKRRSRPRRERDELTVEQILQWADNHHRRTGRWPTVNDGRIVGGYGKTWVAVNHALVGGYCGLPGGSSLAQLLANKRGHRNRRRLAPLTEEQILAWAGDHFRRTHRWPNLHSGPIPGTLGETWRTVSTALKTGARGLPAVTTLSKLLLRHRGVSPSGRLAASLQSPGLTEEQILEWGDNYHQRAGTWPTTTSVPVAEGIQIAWSGIDNALVKGLHGLPGGSSLARLWAARRGHRNKSQLPDLTEEQILAWADNYFETTQSWPKINSGAIPGTTAANWQAVDNALRQGMRGLPGGSSLPQLLASRRGIRYVRNLPRLSEGQILAWADDHYQRTGRWPTVSAGSVLAATQENWATLSAALTVGNRGLPGGSSLAQLLSRERGVPNRMDLPCLTVEQILAWADDHHQRTGNWPTPNSGPIAGADQGQTWLSVHSALHRGLRGLPGGASLPQLLARKRGVRNIKDLPSLTVEQILAWADDHHQRTGQWPSRRSGPVLGADQGQTWESVHQALRAGLRGLTGGSSLPRLLKRFRRGKCPK
jgi:pyrroloquinoline quinone (PQQ) biosynthesis protein C